LYPFHFHFPVYPFASFSHLCLLMEENGTKPNLKPTCSPQISVLDSSLDSDELEVFSILIKS
ncbi:unnamed protein product, partial [Linum tenue]